MANSIEKIAVFQKALDTAMVQQSVTGWMEGNAGQVIYHGGDEVKIPSIAMDGLADYDRANGFVEGDVTLAYETMKMTQDRGRGFTVDPMDIDESGIYDLMSRLAGEFQRTMVVPEVDAYRLSKIAKLVGATRRRVYTPAASSVLKALQEDIGTVRNLVGESEPLVVHLSGSVSTLLNTSTELSKRLDVTTFSHGGIETRVRSIDEVPLLPTASSRMISRVEIVKNNKGGFKKATGAADLNWIICMRRGPIAVSKTDNMRLFDPNTWQKANAWHMDYRKFHDLWIPKNKLDGFFVNMAAADASIDASGESAVDAG